MSNGVLNAEVLQGIARTSFYGALGAVEAELVHPKLTKEVSQKEITVTYTSFGEVPEPREMSGSVAATGERQTHGVADYKVVGTVIEREQTVGMKRATIETNPGEIPIKTGQMARKAMIYKDRRFIATVLPATTAGYNRVSLYNDAHLESGTAQDNNLTAVAATGTVPTAAELEASLDTEIAAI